MKKLVMKGVVANIIPSLAPLIVKLIGAKLLSSNSFYISSLVNLTVTNTIMCSLLALPFSLERYTKSDYLKDEISSENFLKSLTISCTIISLIIAFFVIQFLSINTSLPTLVIGYIGIAINISISYSLIQDYCKFNYNLYSKVIFLVNFLPLLASFYFSATLQISTFAYTTGNVLVALYYLNQKNIRLESIWQIIINLIKNILNIFKNNLYFTRLLFCKLCNDNIKQFALISIPLSIAGLSSSVFISVTVATSENIELSLMTISLIYLTKDCSLRATNYVSKSLLNVLLDGKNPISSDDFKEIIIKSLIASFFFSLVSAYIMLYLLPIALKGNLALILSLDHFRVILFASILLDSLFVPLYSYITLSMKYFYSLAFISLPRDMGGLVIFLFLYPLIGAKSLAVAMLLGSAVALISTLLFIFWKNFINISFKSSA